MQQSSIQFNLSEDEEDNIDKSLIMAGSDSDQVEVSPDQDISIDFKIDNLTPLEQSQIDGLQEWEQNDQPIPDLDASDVHESQIESQTSKLEKDSFKLRDNQIQLFKDSCEKIDSSGKVVDYNNSIIYLETGQGKTVISMMHMYYYLRKFKGDKKVIFLAQTVQLVEQQCQQIRKLLYDVSRECDEKLGEEFTRYMMDSQYFTIDDFKNEEFINEFVIPIHAEKAQDGSQAAKDNIQDFNRWTRDRWNDVLEKSTVFVMIGQILLNALRRGYIQLSEISLIVMDECHHAKLQHPFKQILQEFYHDQQVAERIGKSKEVKILGLTASPVLNVSAKKIISQQNRSLDSDQFKMDLYQLCLNLDSKVIVLPSREQQCQNIILDYKDQFTDKELFKNFLVEYPQLESFYRFLYDQLNSQSLKTFSYRTQLLIRDLIERHLLNSALTLLFDLGKYPYLRYLEKLQQSFRKCLLKFLNAPKGNKKMAERDALDRIDQEMNKQIESLRKISGYGSLTDPNNLSQKFQILLKFIKEEIQESLKKYQEDPELKFIAEFIDDAKGYSQEKVNQKLPMILIFVTSKITSHYMYEVIQDLKKMDPQYKDFSVDFVQGVGRKDTESHQNLLINDRNVYVDQEQKGETFHLQKAEELFQLFKVRGDSVEDEEQKGEQQDQGAQIMRGQMEEVNEGNIKGFSLYQTRFDINKQRGTIEQFRKRKFNILVTTNVVEEGFDIPECGLVIVYEHINSLKQYIQQKGRVRNRADPKFVLVTNIDRKNVQGQLQIYDEALRRIKRIALECKDMSLESMRQAIKQITESKQRERLTGDASIRPEYYERCIVTNKSGLNTLSLINTNWAIEILGNYVNYCQGIRTGIKNEYFVKGAFYFYAKYPAVGYICYILLPKTAEGRRIYYGDIKDTKEDARRSAAFKAVVDFRKKGFLLDDLRPKKEEMGNQYGDIKKLNEQEQQLEKEGEMVIKQNFDKEGKQVQSIEKHFKGNCDEAFNFDFTNSSMRMMDAKTVHKFTIFRFQFIWKIRKMDLNFNAVNSANEQEFGLMHLLDFPVSAHDFTAEKSTSHIKVAPLDEVFECTWQDYQDMKEVSNFLFATALDEDISFYSHLKGQKIRPGGNLDKRSNKQNNFIGIDNSKNLAVLVILKYQGNRWVLDTTSTNEIKQYVNFMKGTYEALNNMKDQREEVRVNLQKKKQLEENGQLEEAKLIDTNYRKVTPHTQHNEFISKQSEEDLKRLNGSYIIQNISDTSHISKFVLQDYTEAGDLSKQIYKVGLSMKDKVLSLKKTFFTVDFTKDRFLFAAVLLKNHLRPYNAAILERPVNSPDREIKFKYFSSEWAKFPLNIEAYLRLKIIVDHILAQFRDYLLVCYYKGKRLLDLEKDGLRRANNHEIYRFHTLKCLSLEEDKNIMRFMEEDQECKQLHKKLKQNIADSNYSTSPSIQPKQQIWKPIPIIQNFPDKLIFKALTTATYNPIQEYNLEVLEFLGDAVLKLLGSVEVFTCNQLVMEGDLHVLRAKLVSNANLKQLAIQLQLYQFILTDRVVFSPQSFILQENLQLMAQHNATQGDQLSVTNTQIQTAQLQLLQQSTLQLQQSMTMNTQLPKTFKRIPEKALADAVEALIGVCMQTFKSIDHCQFFLFELGLLKYPTLQLDLGNQLAVSVYNTGLIKQNMEKVESIIKYKFKRPQLLVQAFTHISFLNVLDRYQSRSFRNDNNPLINNFVALRPNLKEIIEIGKGGQEITPEIVDQLNEYATAPYLSYERLEFLGDAFLDCVVVQWLCQKYPNQGPGELSAKKQSVVSNKALSLVTIYYNLDYYILHPTITKHENALVIDRIRKEYKTFYDDIKQLYNNENAIKILGDIVESLVGAIYVDSGFNYELTKSIVMELMEDKFIQHFSKQSDTPHSQLQILYKLQHHEIVEPIQSEDPPINGQYNYCFTDKLTGEVLDTVRAGNPKEAIENLLEFKINGKQY